MSAWIEPYGRCHSDSPPAKRLRAIEESTRPRTRSISRTEDPYATVNLAGTLQQLQRDASAQQSRAEQADCVRRTSVLFDVFGYTVILPLLQQKYKGSLAINDWHDDVRSFLERAYEQEKLSKEQEKLVQIVETVATSGDLLTYEQWRCLLCLNVTTGSSGKGEKMKKIHLDEIMKVKKLAKRVLDGSRRSTVLQLIKALENVGTAT